MVEEEMVFWKKLSLVRGSILPLQEATPPSDKI
jgi:hypothetical protein